jgi:Sulfate permease and related transporters (MFS superfamily)
VINLKKEEWFSNIRTDVLAGLVVGLALIPESIAFSAIAVSIRKSAYMPLSVLPCPLPFSVVVLL